MVLARDGGTLYTTGADAGPALFAFSDEGTPAFVYLPQSQALLRWTADHFEPAGQIGDAVLSMASPGPGRVSLAVKRNDGIWTVDPTGAGEFLIPPVDGPVLLRNDGSVLYAAADHLVLHRPDGTDQVVGGTGIEPARLVSNKWLRIGSTYSPGFHASLRDPTDAGPRADIRTRRGAG